MYGTSILVWYVSLLPPPSSLSKSSAPTCIPISAKIAADRDTVVELTGVVSGGGKESNQMRSPLMIIESFLRALTSADKDGRIVISKAG